jgi:hypothetical protein
LNEYGLVLRVCTAIAYAGFLKNITFSADEGVIERARAVAKTEHKTLNVAFREWLAGYAARKGNVQQHRALMERLEHINPGCRYAREAMNER